MMAGPDTETQEVVEAGQEAPPEEQVESPLDVEEPAVVPDALDDHLEKFRAENPPEDVPAGDEKVSPDEEAAEEVPPEEAAEPPEEVPEAEVEEPPEIPLEAVASAAAMGVPEDLARRLNAQGLLDEVLDGIDARALAGPAPEVPSREAPAKPEAQPKPTAEGEFKLELPAELAEEYPGLAESLQGLQAHYQGETGQLRQDVAKLVELAEDQALAERARKFDAFVGGLDPAYQELLGKEPGKSLDEKGPQMQKRVLLLEEAEALTRGHAAMGRDLPFEVACDRALHATLAKEVGAVERKKLSAKAKELEGTITPRPTGVKAPATPPTEAEGIASMKEILDRSDARAATEGPDEL